MSAVYLDEIIRAQKRGEGRGIVSICSAHPYVLETALKLGKECNIPMLIEATCNQVNQYGGYTGMSADNFARFVRQQAGACDFPAEGLILGGDHLGPLVWSQEPAAEAMTKAKALVQAYVRAGFTKIHLDASMKCADDQELPEAAIAQRTAELAAAAESAADDCTSLRYVIGTEVPPAGGAKAREEQLAVTKPGDAATTIEITRRAFCEAGLESTWERVIALVVQPGIEFGNSSIHEYQPQAAKGLSRFIESLSGLVYEAHSSDYQTRASLRALVEDHFAILKVGPALTFAFREAVFALTEMEKTFFDDARRSHIHETLEAAMLANPIHWQQHYAGTPAEQKFACQYSFSDRIRYYWTVPEVQSAFEKLLANLGNAPLPLPLISQYAPESYRKIRDEGWSNSARDILRDRIRLVLEDYLYACGVKMAQITPARSA